MRQHFVVAYDHSFKVRHDQSRGFLVNRMWHAQELLEPSNDKLEVVAAHVSCESAFVFSCVFKRWIAAARRSIAEGTDPGRRP